MLRRLRFHSIERGSVLLFMAAYLSATVAIKVVFLLTCNSDRVAVPSVVDGGDDGRDDKHSAERSSHRSHDLPDMPCTVDRSAKNCRHTFSIRSQSCLFILGLPQASLIYQSYFDAEHIHIMPVSALSLVASPNPKRTCPYALYSDSLCCTSVSSQHSIEALCHITDGIYH